MTHSAEIVNRYLDAFWAGDFAAARKEVAEDVSYAGPFVQVQGAEAFFKAAAGLLPIIRGYRMLRQWEDGESVCSFYEFLIETPAGKGAVPSAEWSTVKEGRLTEVRLLFDTAAFRKLVPVAT